MLELAELDESGAAAWPEDRSAAYAYAAAALFPAVAVVAVYVGAVGRSQRYVGAKTDAQLYVGAGTLFG